MFDARGRQIAQRRLPAPAVGEDEVAVAPDGDRIAYLGTPRDPEQVNTGDLTIERIAGSRPSRRLSRAVGTPSWSPDGRRIAVERWSASEARGEPHGVQEASRLVTTRSTSRAGGDLVLVPPSGGPARTVLGDVRTGEDSWDVSPDGRWLAVAGAGQGDPDYHLSLVDLRDRTARRLTDDPASDVRWSPDGAWLAAIVDDRILVLDRSGATPARLLARFPGRRLSALAWAPDGRRLAVSSASPSRAD